MKKLIRETAEEILEEFTNCYSEADEDCLVNMLGKLASDVAREIFEEIDEILFEYENAIQAKYRNAFEARFAELKKKYIGEDTNAHTNTEEGK